MQCHNDLWLQVALRVKVTRWLEGVLELLYGARAELVAANAVFSVVLLARVAAALLELTALLQRPLSLTGAQLTQLHADANSPAAARHIASAAHTPALRSSKTPDAADATRCSE